MTTPRIATLVIVLVCLPAASAAQGYRIRVDTRWQSVAYRGVALDSIPTTDTVSSAVSGPASPDGFAVRCQAGAAFCTFFRPGTIRRGGPVTTTLDLTLWGFGVTGLSIRASGRGGFDIGSMEVWPGTEPAVQLLEGYAEYAMPRVTARLGRQVIASRLGISGFDGAALSVRPVRMRIELQAYGGWGLAQGAALPVTSPALNPLDDFQPRQRQLLAGFAAGWTSATTDARVEYQREVDPQANKFVSERIALDGALRLAAAVRVAGGAEYDMAAGWWGSADATAAYVTPRLRSTLGLKRYRPHFDLWTIWGAFSPVPYHSVQTSVAFAATSRIEIRGRYERYRFAEAEAETPLLTVKRDGWRVELGGTVTPWPEWTLDAGYQREFGPGAGVGGTAASLTYEPSRRFRATVLASAVARPLEFRFNDAVVRTYGVDAQYLPSDRLRIGLALQRYAASHDRPDAAAFDWRQFRASLRVALAFGNGDDLPGLPPAIRILPGDRSAR
jgi:hypothetical protein